MGSTSYLTKPKSAGYRAKSGSSVGSDKEMNGKLKRNNKIRRPTKMNDYGLKRVPDYTELAYKEAVSKLRYFLSGNYAPSVRSYGGSASIKNLDESDGDLDKKYSPYSHTLAEYKPRPRLTAKYTTLYADSLNNYTPPQHTTSAAVPPAAASPADVSGGTNPDVVNFIQKQEEYIEQLERESQYCRDELNNLLGKVKEVISENEHLHEAQKNKLITRMFHSYAGSETDDLDDVGDSTGLDSDNKISPSKTRKTAKTRSTRLEGPNIVFESRIAELEAQLTQSKIDLKKVQDENNENKRKLASGLVDSTCLDGFKRQIDNLQRDKSALESQISKLKLSLDSRDDGFKRSDGLENQLREERNSLETELRRLKDDLAKERSKVRELAGEGARRAIQERSAAEQRYNAHFDELQHDLAAQYDNVAKLQLELERNRREDNELKREISMKNNAIDELKMELKNKTSSLQADLAQAHAEKASLDEELASARLAIERHQRQSKHETNRLNSEIQSLRQRLDRADADLVHSRRENLRLSEQISTLEKELNMKTLTPITPEKTKKEKELTTMLDSIENKHAKTVAELETMIQSQNSLMEKLTGECRLLTDKLDDATRRHKQELATLQRQVDSLGRSIQASPRTAPSSYTAPTTHATPAERDVPAAASSRPVDPRAESPGLPRDSSLQPLGDQRHDRQAPRQLTKQPSRTLLYNEPQASETHIEEPTIKYSEDTKKAEDSKEVAQIEQEEEDEVMEVEQPPTEYQAQNYEEYEQTQPITEPEYQTQEYEQGQPVTESEGQVQEYDQTYEQPAYAEGQYENYEQYPQQYTDPNVQYEADPNAYATDPNAQYQGDPNAQYENYAPDGNYTTEQNYDTAQYNQEYQETPQYQEQPEEKESKDTVPSQS